MAEMLSKARYCRYSVGDPENLFLSFYFHLIRRAYVLLDENPNLSNIAIT